MLWNISSGKVPFVLHYEFPVFLRMSRKDKRAKFNLCFDFLVFLINWINHDRIPSNISIIWKVVETWCVKALMKWTGTANSHTTHLVDETKICIPNKLHLKYLSDLLRSSLNSPYLITFSDNKVRFSRILRRIDFISIHNHLYLKTKSSRLKWRGIFLFFFRFLCVINRGKIPCLLSFKANVV